MPAVHPSAAELRDFLLGKSPAEACDQIAAHLDACPDCTHSISQFDAEVDTLVARLHAGGEATADNNPQLRRALDFVKKIGKTAAPKDGSPTPSAAQLGQLREYRLLEKLGEGGMGAVYKALHTRLNKIVAVKVLPRDKMQTPGAVARFEREMRAVGSLDHPHLIRAHDAGEVDGEHFLVMEYVAGCDLSQLVKERGPLPIADACEAVRQAALGLAEAHRRGMVHRDIKPSNLMLTDKGQIKVLDLGLALLADQHGEHDLTSSGQFMGTIDYMAPEQGGDSHKVDARADLYSLGATLYKLLTGEAPFGGPKYDTLMRKMLALSSDIPAPLNTQRPDVPPPLAAIVARLLAKDPRDRFASADEVAAALAQFAAGARLLASPAASAGATAAPEATLDHLTWKPSVTAAAISPSLATIASPPPRGPRKGAYLAAAAGAAALLLCLGVWFIFRDKDGKELGRVHVPDDATVTIQPDQPQPATLPAKVPQAAPQAPATPVQPASPVRPASREKPVVLVRGGAAVREYRQLNGALEEHQPGDVIELHGPGPFALNLPDQFDQPLHLRGAGGHRPRIEPSGGRVGLSKTVRIEHCDITMPPEQMPFFSHLQLVNCRWQAAGILLYGTTPRLEAENSLFLLFMGFEVGATAPTIRLQNCLVRSSGPVINLTQPGQADVELRQCTFYNETGGRGPLLQGVEKSSARVLAEGNIFHSFGQMELLMLPDWRKTVAWQGRDNLYSGILFGIHNEKNEFVRRATIEDWSQLWAKPETGSELVEQFEPHFVRSTILPLPELRASAEPVVRSASERLGLPTLGCNWDLLGPGDAYVRALERLEHKPAELRPEVASGGPISLFQRGKEVGSFRTVAEAVAQAEDLGVIEIRTDKVLPAVGISGETARRLTLRAGPGYSPVLQGLQSYSKDIWTLEGLTFDGSIIAGAWEGDHFNDRGGVHRMLNCTMLAGGISQGFRCAAQNGDPPTIANSRLGQFHGATEPGQTIHFDNCLLFSLTTGQGEKFPGTGDALLNKCVFWGLEPHFAWRARMGSMLSSIHTRAHSKYTVNDCYFAGPETIFHHFDTDKTKPPIPWRGERNVFAAPFRDIAAGRGDTSTLEQWQKFVQQESGSFLDLPPLFDPRQWKLAPGTPGAGKGAGGSDLGADVSQVATPSPT